MTGNILARDCWQRLTRCGMGDIAVIAVDHKLMIAPSSALLLAAVILPAAAAPLATPCAPGDFYDPACDVDHDGDVDIFDIQLAANHWNQSGTRTGGNSVARIAVNSNTPTANAVLSLRQDGVTRWSIATVFADGDLTFFREGAGGGSRLFIDGGGANTGYAGISTADADGVALAAIRALYQLVLAQQAQLADQQQRIAALEARGATSDPPR